MAHISGITYVSSNQVFANDDTNEHVIEQSAPINASAGPVSVGRIRDADFRVYAGTFDGNIALFPNGDMAQLQLFHVTDQPVLWSLYHAGGTIYLGTGDFSAPGPFSLIALDDQTFTTRWQVSSAGPVSYPAGVAYQNSVPAQVIFTSSGPNGKVRGLDVATGGDLWSASDFAFGQKVHDGVVYYGNLGDNSLRARSAADGTLLWSFTNPLDFNFQVPKVAGGVVWASTVGNQIFALRASDGSMLWEGQIDGHPGAPVVLFDHEIGLSLVAVAEQNGATAGFLKGLDANTGAPLWTSNVPVSQDGQSCTDPIVAWLTEDGPMIQVGTGDGTLMSFAAEDGQLVWQRQLSPNTALIAKPHWVFL